MDAELEAASSSGCGSTPPSCVGGFRLTRAELPIALDRVKSASVEWEICIKSVWRLGCNCGEERGHVLGHPLRDLNPDYDGPEFLGPLGFECSACGKVTEIIDTDLHGYHVEVARIEGGVGSVKVRGEGIADVSPARHARRIRSS